MIKRYYRQNFSHLGDKRKLPVFPLIAFHSFLFCWEGEVLIVTLRRKPNRFEHRILGSVCHTILYTAANKITSSYKKQGHVTLPLHHISNSKII